MRGQHGKFETNNTIYGKIKVLEVYQTNDRDKIAGIFYHTRIQLNLIPLTLGRRMRYFTMFVVGLDILISSYHAHAESYRPDNRQFLKQIVNQVLIDGVLRMDRRQERSIAQGVCYAEGLGSLCNTIDTIGKSICVLSLRNSECARVANIGEGICRANGRGDYCGRVRSVPEGICRAEGRGSVCDHVGDDVGKGLCHATGRNDCIEIE